MSLEDQQLILEIQKQFQEKQSPTYDDYEKISEQYSQLSQLDNEEDDSVIRVIPDSDSSLSRSQEKKSRWKYCCFKCTKSDKGSVKPKTCVCIVPASQRRIQIGEQGCLTCQCTGCSIEDSKKRKKKVKKRKSSSSESSDDEDDFKTVNGCCKKCMKAFSKKGKEAKSCLCQVPRAVRKKPLPAHGCQYCGCHGCNPEDKKKEKKRPSRTLSPVSDDLNEQNLQNFQRNPLINWLNEQNMNATALGIGIPQRTYSYIYGGQR